MRPNSLLIAILVFIAISRLSLAQSTGQAAPSASRRSWTALGLTSKEMEASFGATKQSITDEQGLAHWVYDAGDVAVTVFYHNQRVCLVAFHKRGDGEFTQDEIHGFLEANASGGQWARETNAVPVWLRSDAKAQAVCAKPDMFAIRTREYDEALQRGIAAQQQQADTSQQAQAEQKTASARAVLGGTHDDFSRAYGNAELKTLGRISRSVHYPNETVFHLVAVTYIDGRAQFIAYVVRGGVNPPVEKLLEANGNGRPWRRFSSEGWTQDGFWGNIYASTVSPGSVQFWTDSGLDAKKQWDAAEWESIRKRNGLDK